MSENLATILTATAERHGDQTAFKLDDVELTYSMLDGATAHVAGLLKERGLEPGDRVGLMLPNVPYFPVIYYGILRAGGVVVPMNVLLKAREVKFYVGDSGSKLLFALGSANHDEDVFTDPERFDLDRSPEELAQILSFGGGRHFCLGANLARLEARVVLDSLVRRVRSVEVDHDRCVRFYSANVRGFEHVPARLVVR